MDDVLGLCAGSRRRMSGFAHFWAQGDVDHAQRRGAAAADVGQRLGRDLLEGLAAAPRARRHRSAPCRRSGPRRRSTTAASSSPPSTAKRVLRAAARRRRSPRRRAARSRRSGHVDSQLTRRLRDALHGVLAPAAVRPGAARLDRQHGALHRPVRHRLGHLPRAASASRRPARSRSSGSPARSARRW